MSSLPANPSPSVRRRNPSLYPAQNSPALVPARFDEPTHTTTPLKRLRQSQGPLLNRLEAEWYARIKDQYPNFPPVRPQALKLKIGNGAWYRGDMFCASWPQDDGPAMPTIWECKGTKEMKNIARGILTIKTAAHQWPEFAFFLVWKEEHLFAMQRVLP